MVNARIKISSIVENQLPTFVKEDFPLVAKFLSQYYESLEHKGATLDILQNIDKYVKLDEVTNLIDSTTTTSFVGFSDDTIFVTSTEGFSDSYGLLKINSEIITYTSKTNNSFLGCVRGFSGVTSYQDPSKVDHLVFSSSEIDEHQSGSTVSNLSILFLKEFFKKIKKQFVPGFENRELYSELNENLFIKQSKDFYSSKGTDQSFEILFRALYGEDVQVIKPRDYLFIPSDAQYRLTRDLVVEVIEGNPNDIVNRTLYQDNYGTIPKSSGAINNVEKIFRGEKEYYVISLDYNPNAPESDLDEFSVHPQTTVITDAKIGSTVLDVDSTVGFPNSGEIIADLENGSSVVISYKSKSYTQFYECSGITQDINSGQNIRINTYAYSYSGLGTSNVVKLRITGVLSDLEVGQNTRYYSTGNKIQIESLGKNDESIEGNTWIFNLATSYDVETVNLIDNINFSYQIKTYDDTELYVGDTIVLFFSDGTKVNSNVTSVSNKKTFSISGQGQIDRSKKIKIQKQLSKAKFSNFPKASIYSANVQNTYYDKEGSYYVTSSSLPSYFNEELSTKDRSLTFSGTFEGEDLNIGKHGFYTGDSVVYEPISPTNSLGITQGTYFVRKVDANTIKLARSRENLYKNIYITFSAAVIDNKISFVGLSNKTLSSQKLVRSIQTPQNVTDNYETKFGTIGILANGVEILNYKSRDKIFYGPLEKINVLSPGTDYDVINPPILSINDTVGTGATGYCEVHGKLEDIEVIDGGFDYIGQPTITITGGSGSGARAIPELFSFEHSVTFNSSAGAGLVNLTNNTISFSTQHKFRDAEKIIYKTDKQTAIGGITTDAVYHVSVQDSFTVKVHNTYQDALVGINTIDLTSFGNGIQRFVSTDVKKKITSIKVIDPGSGYKNRKISVSPTGINTNTNTIFAQEHNYKTGEIIVYTATGNEIGGLVSGNSYYVTAVDNNSFKLSVVGSASTIGIGSAIVGISTNKDFYFSTKQFVGFNSTGSGIHYFNYEPISVKVSGVIGVSTRTNQNFDAVLDPIFRGEIKSVFLESGGSNYGTDDIINFNRQPSFTLNSGSGAELSPIVSAGKITEILVINPGSGYNSTPSLQIVGTGVGAKLSPVVKNGSISEVKVLYNGQGFTTSTTILNVIPSGSGAKFEAVPKVWTVNLVERSIISEEIYNDDGTIVAGLDSDYGLQYTHSYPPRYLRRTVSSKSLIGGNLTFSPDLQLENGKEVLSKLHSPIIGWAYDGNPIYGPYGYSNLDGGSIKLLESGYKISLVPGRPSTTLYPEGFFVEDYKYNQSGDLDKFNGRFCVTPEYPNGTYAYFSTINTIDVETSGPFRNYRRPVFPYFIGNEYKSKPIDYNFSLSSNQDNIDLNKTKFLRNTKPYNLNNEFSKYDFIINPNKIKKQTSVVTKVNKGSVDFIGINSAGSNYKVTNRLVFNNTDTEGQGASFEVSSVKGKPIGQISVSTTSITNVEFVPLINADPGVFVGFSTSPHTLSNFDFANISGISTFGTLLEGSRAIGVRSEVFVLGSDVLPASSTGIVTYFNVYGTLYYPNIRENDILGIGTEKIKVLNIDPKLSRIRVYREYDGTVGTSHTLSTSLYERPRKFAFKAGISTVLYQYKYNKEIYFDPKESVGLGTVFGVGIGYTLTFSNPGIGISSLFIPTKSIYLPNHNLNTGDSLIYSSNGGSPISISTNGTYSYQLSDNQTLFVARITDNLIGIATNRVGVGSTGNFVGINSSIFTDTLYFTDFGNGVIHSFKTNYENVITGKATKNLVTVSTASSHGLQVFDEINVTCNPGLSTTYIVKYNNPNKRLVINPKDFSSSDVDLLNDTITILSHGYRNAQKIIHTSTSPCDGLKNQKIYYIVVVDENKFKLSETFYNASIKRPVVVNITSSSFGTISPINPPVIALRNQPIIFDLTDQSLSYVKNSQRYPAFKFNLYTDENFKNIFETSTRNKAFEISREGIVGVTTNAKITIDITDNLPKVLYYSLTPINLDENDQNKLSIIKDTENIVNNNAIIISNSAYSGNHKISKVTENSFSYNIRTIPEKSSYLPSESKLEYTTTSRFASGEIDKFRTVSPGSFYKRIPTVVSIATSTGDYAALTPSSKSIGNVLSTEIEDIGFEYSADKTLRPTAKLAQIIKVNNLLTFDRIGITSIGKNYTTPPDLVVLDFLTNTIIDDVNLSFKLTDKEVKILKNTKSIDDRVPRIVPVNNSNGISINSISFNKETKNVVVSLATTYSDASDYPFQVGDKVFIEGTSVGIGTTLRGYNSSSYNYEYFTLTSIDPNIGGSGGTITYNLSNYLRSNEDPGIFNQTYSSGKVVLEKYTPIFNVTLKKNKFFKNETLLSKSANGIVDGWDDLNQILKVFSDRPFKQGERVIGSSSGSQAIISFVEENNATYDTGANSIVKKGWKRETGFFNNSNQRIHDSDYYQYFSYSIKSKVQYDKWNDVVSNQNHTIGFKKFADLLVESVDETSSGISTDQNLGDFIGITDLISVNGLNCVSDFDLASEKTLNIDSNTISKEIVLNSAIVQDYLESVGNRVLVIDDISPQFNSNPRSSNYGIIDTFRLSPNKVKKYIIYIRDMRYTAERQSSIVSILNSPDYSFISQYASLETVQNLGTFDVSYFGDEGNLLFYPTNYQINDYDVSYISYDLEDSIAGVSTFTLGNVVDIKSSSVIIPSGTSGETTIVGISSNYTSSKILVTISALDESYCEFDEVSIVHDGTNVSILEYGQLTSGNLDSTSTQGLGNYETSFSGSNLNLNFTPHVGVGVSYVINTLSISIGNTSTTTTGISSISTNRLKSSYTSIASTSSPSQNVICEYEKFIFNSAYYIVSVNDTTNNRSQLSEVIVINDSGNVYITEFGKISTGDDLGSISANISGNNVQLYFTPIENTNIEVRVFENILGLTDVYPTNPVDLNSSSISSKLSSYYSAFSEIKRTFDLKNKKLPIFERNFEGNNPNIVDINKNTIRIPNHFFVTGEELSYSYSLTSGPIGIASTSFSGIGVTNKLPSSVYAIKVNELELKLASSAENALKTFPIELDITSVGIGSIHKFTSKNQNSRVLISIDNVIQSPIVSTAITSSSNSEVLITQDTINLSGITSIFGGDLLKIDNEIVRVKTVGFGSTNVLLVDRGWMGTGIASHAQHSVITKVFGDYNIVNNSINFVSPPYGPVPIGTTSSRPDEKDWIGITTNSSFSGRVFVRSGVKNSSSEPYSKNYIFDDISESFSGIKTEFRLKSNKNDVFGFSEGNSIVLINQVLQGPCRNTFPVSVTGNYLLKENAGITTIQFIGNSITTPNDHNTSNVPVGGSIVSVASSKGFGYQPLVSAAGTAIVSISGTIQSISIGNSGSGYRSGIQKIVNVGILTSNNNISNIEFIGIASVSGGNVVSVAITNPGTGYTFTNPPLVFFDAPLSYSNIPLVYSNSSPLGVGVGTQATIDIVVGQGSSVIDFEIKNIGYGYGQGEILTVSIGGTVGIPTNSSLQFEEFKIIIEKTQSDRFSSWVIGDLQVLDEIQSLFDGNRVSFPITTNGQQKSIKARAGSLIDVEATLLVFLNDILQVPGQGYVFKGGSNLTFTEAPKEGDTCKILFYKGTGDVDVLDVDILESVKIGDYFDLHDDKIELREDERIITNILSTDTLNTNNYSGPGITLNENLKRPINWCKQTEDVIIDGKSVTKDRTINEPLIYPSSNIIKSVGVGSTVIYVESVKTFFDNQTENTSNLYVSDIEILSQDSVVSASATAILAPSGGIASILVTDGGVGYTTSPTVSISNPVGFGTTTVVTASATVSAGGTISSIAVISSGIGYSVSPSVLIEPPTFKKEPFVNATYTGDFGYIVGSGKTNVGVGSTGITLDLFIPADSYLRQPSIVGSAITVPSIQIGDYFVVKNSNIGFGITTLYSDNSIIGVGTECIDNIFEVSSSSVIRRIITGIGLTYVTRITTNVSNLNGYDYNQHFMDENITGTFDSEATTFDTTDFTFDSVTTFSPVSTPINYGTYSWGKIIGSRIQNSTSFNSYTLGGVSGLSTSAIVIRKNPLRYKNYAS
jgi:hypothetical protein